MFCPVRLVEVFDGKQRAWNACIRALSRVLRKTAVQPAKWLEFHHTVLFTSISHKPEFISNIPEKSWEIRVTKKPNKSWNISTPWSWNPVRHFFEEIAKVPIVIQIRIAFLGRVYGIHPVCRPTFSSTKRGSKGWNSVAPGIFKTSSFMLLEPVNDLEAWQSVGYVRPANQNLWVAIGVCRIEGFLAYFSSNGWIFSGYYMQLRNFDLQ